MGILPISQSSFSDRVFLADFPITGSGEAYANCGSWFTVGCLNVEEHKGMTLDGVDFTGKAYIERHRRSCHRSLCPICWEDWATREMKKAKKRLEAFVITGRRLKPIHVTVSVPHVDYGLSPQEMRKKAYRVLKSVHMIGGMVIYHSKRKNALKSWYFSPHFHVLGYGWIVDVRRNYISSGYIVKNVGIRKTVEGTIFYQLSHAGISRDGHAVTWFGALSYAKLHVKYDEKEDLCCPICGLKLRQLLWIGQGDNPFLDPDEEEGEAFYDDPGNWLEKPMRRWYADE